MSEIAMALENVSVRDGDRLALDRVSFSVAKESVYALLGREGSGKSSVVRCLLRQLKPSSGEIFLFGGSLPKRRSELTRRIGVVSGTAPEKFAALLAAALAREPDLLVIESPGVGPSGSASPALLETLRARLGEKPATVLLTAPGPSGIEGIASRVGILKAGRLRVDEEMAAMKANFRRITYRNEMTESRTDFGSELDDFDAVGVRVRGSGIEAIVQDYGEDKFRRFCARDGVVDAAASPVSLEDVFLAVEGRVALAAPM